MEKVERRRYDFTGVELRRTGNFAPLLPSTTSINYTLHILFLLVKSYIILVHA